MNDAFLFFFLGLSSLFLTELIRRYAIKQQLIDIPNERSSHTNPTPYGGGVSIAALFLVTLIFIESLPNLKILCSLFNTSNPICS